MRSGIDAPPDDDEWICPECEDPYCDGRCPNCGEDELASGCGSQCYYCGN